MALSLKLPRLDDNPILLAETRPNKISEFIKNLPYGDPIRAAADLTEELQTLNTQKVAYANRVNALELYRPAAIRIHQELLPHFNQSALPISKSALSYANAAEQLWQEVAYGYKTALVDLQNKILNIGSSKSTALAVQRAIHALKQIILISYLKYHVPASSVWSEIHQLYFCALQQSSQALVVSETLPYVNESTVNAIYTQVLLFALATPHRLSNADITRTDDYLTKIAGEAELRPLGYVENPTGVFLVELDGNKPPTPFVKNRNLPDATTDILLVTVNLARRIHAHLKLLNDGIVPNDGSLPSNSEPSHYADLLAHLIKHFGKSPLRVFNRIKKSDGIEMGIGMHSAHHFIGKMVHDYKSLLTSGAIMRPSRWQILNTSAGGYALRKFNSSPATLYVGDVTSIKHHDSQQWEIGVVRWANITALEQLDVGVELISPKVTAIGIKSAKESQYQEALLLPELPALKQLSSIMVSRGKYSIGETLEMDQDGITNIVLLTKLVERTATFERFRYSLI